MKKYRLFFLIILLMFPVTSWILIFLCMILNWQFISSIYLFVGIFLTLILLLCLILLILALKKLSAELLLAREVKLLEQHTSIAELQHKELESLNLDAKERQQTFIRHLIELDVLIRAQDYKTARKRIHEITDSDLRKGTDVYCSDFFINTILQIKMNEAQEHNIRTDCHITLPPLKDNSNLNYLELSSLFFNLLDNAIESCIRSGSNDPFLTLEISWHKKILQIHMENTKDSMIQFDGSTTKEDKESHGFGLKIIEEIIREHDGICRWTDRGDTFDSVLLMNYTK